MFQNFKIIIPGDFELKVGQKINMDVIKSSTSEHLGNPTSMIDNYTSGTYMVKKINHTFDNEFISEVEIMRDLVVRCQIISPRVPEPIIALIASSITWCCLRTLTLIYYNNITFY